jgi:hypothetical protein
LGIVSVETFDSREALEDKLFEMNYDDGVNPELACIDGRGTAFLACGTDHGDEMGIAYYLTNAEGYMYHYGAECEATEDVRRLLQWKPEFPVLAIHHDKRQP